MLMFGYFSILFGIELSIFRNVFPYAVCRFAKVIAKIRVSGFRHFIILRREITGVSLRPVQACVFCKSISLLMEYSITYFEMTAGNKNPPDAIIRQRDPIYFTFTLTLIVFLLPSLNTTVSVIVALPFFLAFTTPFEFTVAIFFLLLL